MVVLRSALVVVGFFGFGSSIGRESGFRGSSLGVAVVWALMRVAIVVVVTSEASLVAMLLSYLIPFF